MAAKCSKKNGARSHRSIGLFQFLMKEIFGVEPEFRDLKPDDLMGFSESDQEVYLAGFADGQEKMTAALQKAVLEQKPTREDPETIN